MSLRRWILVLGLLLIAAPAMASVRAWLDRDVIGMGETVTLNIELQGATGAQPDLSPLDADFERLGVSSSAQVSIVNGARTASRLFAVALSPKREGLLPIPALSVGGESTAPLVLQVTPAAVSVGPGGDVFIEVEVDTTQPYVQQQIDYVVRLFFGVTVLDGQLDDPAPENVRVLRLGNDKSWQVERGGRRYSVVERRFALTPERSGKIQIAAPVFRGRGMDRNGMGGMFGGGLRLSARGEAIELDVRSAPAGAAQPWLPAQQVVLEWVDVPAATEVKAGEPLTIGLRLSAIGLGTDQLPDLDLPDLAGATVYPDQDSSRDSTDGGKLVSERVRRFAVVPQAAGVLRVVAPQLRWWDVSSDVERTATAQVLELQVVAATGASEAATVPPPEVAEPIGQPGGDSVTDTASNLWRALTLVFALAWILTLGWAWRRREVRPVPGAAPSPSVVQLPSLDAALRGGSLREVAQALRASAPEHLAAQRTSLAAGLDDPRQAEAVGRLERRLYAADPDDDAAILQALRAAFGRGPRWRSHAAKPRDAEPLPPLYG